MHDTNKSTFEAIPWCSRLLAAPNLRIMVPSSRMAKPLTKEDSLFATALSSPTTIHAALSFYPRPSPTAEHITSINTLVAMGSDMNGYPAVLHGGIVATLLDEAMGILLSVNADMKHLREVATGHAVGEAADGIGAFTAELNVKYKAPVRTPAVALLKASVLKQEGRKIWLQAKLVQKSGHQEELDGQWIDCAIAEAVFVEPRAARL